MTEPSPGTAGVDWLHTAQQHLRVEDYGAAEVSLRKTVEATPANPEVFVTWAWLCLDIREPVRAKEYADEAYVLCSPHGTVDLVFEVNLVRGWAAYHAANFQTAVESYKNALSCAYRPEQRADVLVHKAFAHEQQQQWGDMWECVYAALPLAVSFSEGQRQELAEVILRAIRYNSGDTVEGWESYVPTFRSGHGSEDVESRVHAGIARRVELLSARTEIRRLRGISAPEGPYPKFPVWPLVFLLICASSAWAWWVSFVIGMIPSGFMIARFDKRKKWKKEAEEFQAAQEELQELVPSVKKMSTQEQASQIYLPRTPQIRA